MKGKVFGALILTVVLFAGCGETSAVEEHNSDEVVTGGVADGSDEVTAAEEDDADEATVESTIDGGEVVAVTEYNAGAGIYGPTKAYYEMSDGTWQCDEYTYDQRLELVGRDPNAVKDTCFVVLTNISDITWEDAFWSIFSSQSSDWLDPEESVVVEMSVVEE